MKYLNKINLLIIVLVISFCTNGISQNLSWEQRGILESRNMKAKLTLDSIQYRQVFIINTSFGRRLDSLEQTTNSVEEKTVLMKNINKDRSKEIKIILTALQYQQYKDDKETMKNRLKAMKPGNYPENDIDD